MMHEVSLLLEVFVGCKQHMTEFMVASYIDAKHKNTVYCGSTRTGSRLLLSVVTQEFLMDLRRLRVSMLPGMLSSAKPR